MHILDVMEENKIRINKYISECGICSRRKADELVQKGLVYVNGQLAEAGTRVDDSDEICVDGRVIGRVEEKVVLAFYKPTGIVCSANGQGARTVFDYIDYPAKLLYIGRLDKDSEGLLLLTNDGELANAISKARYYHEKEYVVTVNRPITDAFLQKMEQGVPILGTVTRPAKLCKLNDTTFSIILTQGLNRQIRRMCEYCGYHVRNLKRIRVMNITLGDMKKGELRKVTETELKEIRRQLESQSQ